MSTDYRNFLALPYEELEELNLAPRLTDPNVWQTTKFERNA